MADNSGNVSGRRPVLGIIVTNLLMSAALIFVFSLNGDILQLINPIVMLVLYIVLFHFLYRRVVWARWTLTALFTISGLTDIAGVFFLLMSGAFAFLMVIFGIAVIRLVSAAILIFAPSVRAYFDSGN
jgi:hypothetical protein